MSVAAAANGGSRVSGVAAPAPKSASPRLYTHRERIESVGRLAGGIAHDFNNLLEVILNYAELALDELDEHPAIRADVQEIERAARRAAELTRRLLSFSRHEAGQVQVLNLNEVVSDLESLLSRTLGEHIDLDFRLDPDLWGSRGDAGGLEQLIVNLAVNARDAMPHGGRLEISTANAVLDHTAGLPTGRCVKLTVSDTGTGMTEEVAARAYEPFFTTKPKGSGTGLGLATVYRVVEQCGGEIDLVTAPGMGSTFVAMFAATDAALTPEQPSHPRRARRNPDKTILVVEDEDAVRRVMSRVLESVGYRVLSAPGADEALDILGRGGASVDLLIADLVLPRMSGSELAHEVAARYPGTPTLLISGYIDGFIAQEAGDNGHHFIGKPFSAAELIGKVVDCLQDARP
jgi:nitrogen-specific signal transduction histidine kinase/CheY-like chemotaxis protein